MAGLDPAIPTKDRCAFPVEIAGTSPVMTRLGMRDDIGAPMPTPRVLISDALSPAAVQIFKDRGVAVDFQPDLGKDKDRLAEVIGGYDGLAIRSATKVTAKILEQARNLKVIGRA